MEMNGKESFLNPLSFSFFLFFFLCSPKTCAAALQSRLLHPNPKVTGFSLTLLDAIFKNCSPSTLQTFSDPSFLDSLRKKLNLADTPVHLKPRIHELIQIASSKVTSTSSTITVESILSYKSKVNELLSLLHSIPPYTNPIDHPTLLLHL
ncbi:hypothetical protein HMI55_005766 [Coelomomyces lativittatus]|nr:hypothetical protein HMI55_005766 [Coelomomyces lativittatus]